MFNQRRQWVWKQISSNQKQIRYNSRQIEKDTLGCIQNIFRMSDLGPARFREDKNNQSYDGAPCEMVREIP